MKEIQLWPDGPLYTGEPVQTDSLALSAFAAVRQCRRAADLGCGDGILMLLMAYERPALFIDGVEKRPEAAERAAENLRRSALAGRCRVITGSYADAPLPAGAYDLVLSNPPYFEPGRGERSPSADRAAMREETQPLQSLCASAARLLQYGGRFCIVYRPERLPELFAALREAGLEPKRLRCVQHTAHSAPSLVLCEARKGGRPGLQFEAPLVLRDADGRESAEQRHITHWEAT